MNYLDKFWDNIFAFLKDGDLPIDNNLAYPNFSFIPTFNGLYSNKLIS